MARTDATEKAKAAAAKALKESKPPAPPLTPADVLARSLSLLEKFAETRDSILLSRVLRFTRHVRTHVSVAALRAVIEMHVPADRRGVLLAALAASSIAATSTGDVAMTVDAGAAAVAVAVANPPTTTPLNSSTSAAEALNNAASATAATGLKMPRAGGPATLEIEAYLTYIVLARLAAVRAWGVLADVSDAFIAFCAPHNKRSIDWFHVRRGGGAKRPVTL